TYRGPEQVKCDECAPGFQALTPGQAFCTKCPEGIPCHGDRFSANETRALPGFYLLGSNPTFFTLACVEGRCLGNNTCAGNTAGIGCLQCKAGLRLIRFAHANTVDPCIPCESWQDAALSILGLVCFYSV
ncbi:unnamed protein product, partial [Polarella glacialis]